MFCKSTKTAKKKADAEYIVTNKYWERIKETHVERTGKRKEKDCYYTCENVKYKHCTGNIIT